MTQNSKSDQGETNSYPEINSVNPTDDTPYIQPIIGKLGWDTRKEYEGLFGLGASPNNGVDFHVFMSFDGVNFDKNAIDNIWNNGTSDKVKQEIDSATAEIPSIESAADSAVSAADAAVASAQVTSAAASAIASATAEAKQGANDAMSRAKSAWDVATNAKSAVTDFDPLLNQAQSDAKAAGSSAAVLRTDMDKVTSLVNDPKTGLNATYQTAASNATTISNVKSDVYQLETTATGLTSRVGNLESTSATQQTELDQTKAAFALKADQTDVDTLKGNVTDLQAESTTQANEIQTKVSTSDVTGMLTSYATQAYTQSLITQKANEWNVNLTSLQTDVNAIKTTGGGVNLAHNTSNTYVIPGDPINECKNIGSLSNDEWAALAGETITIGVTVEWTNWQASGNNRIGFEVAPTKNGTTYWDNEFGLWYYPENGSSGKQRLTVTKTVMGGIDGMDEGYAYVQGGCDTAKISELMIERGSVAHDWSPAPSDMATVTSVTNLSATVDGIKGLVETKADQSEVTQLSDLVQTKVSSGDFTSTTTQLENEINQRVQVGDVISQINQEAGGDTLIQVSNGTKSLILNAGNTIFTGEAWIPGAAISNIQADQVQIGNSRLFSDDGTFNLINQNDSTAAASIKLTTGIMEGLWQPLTQLSNGTNTHALEVGQEGINVTPTIFFNDYPGEAKDTGWVGFSRHQTNGEVIFHTYDDSKELFRVVCASRFNNDLHIDGTLWQQGLSIASGNTIWSGSDYLAIGDHLSNSYTNVMARSFSSQSTLSSKTNIETVDPKDALDLVNRTDIRSYQYTADVAQGKTKRYTSMIIDDVNDVSQYYAPDEFTNEERTGRDDGSAVGYLFLAVKELTRRIKNLEAKLNE